MDFEGKICCEIELIDLEEDDCEDALDEERAREDLVACEIDRLRRKMRISLDGKMYADVLEAADKLKRLAYFKYREEICKYVKACAEGGYADAHVEFLDGVLVKNDGRLTAEAYPHVKALYEAGYVRALRLYGMCREGGIGTERDNDLAKKAYLMGALFDEDEYCLKALRRYLPQLEDYEGENLQSCLYSDLIWGDEVIRQFARVKVAELILQGKITECFPCEGYFLLKRMYEPLAEGFDYAGYSAPLCLMLAGYVLGHAGDMRKGVSVAEAVLSEVRVYIEDLGYSREDGGVPTYCDWDLGELSEEVDELEGMIRKRKAGMDFTDIDETEVYEEWFGIRDGYLERLDSLRIL